MFFDALLLILGLLAFFIGMPLIVYSPIGVVRFFALRKIAREKGPQFKPSPTLMGLNIWFLLVLVSVAAWVPIFIRFDAKAKQWEAKVNLASIYTAQVGYYGEYNTYAGRKGENGSGAFRDLPWSPADDTLYSYYDGGDYLAPTKPKIPMPYKPDGNWPYSIRPEVSTHGFSVLALGNLDRDPCLDVWMINDTGKLANLVDDTRNLVRENMGGQCGEESSAARRRWYDFMDGPVMRIIMMGLGLFMVTSPTLIFVGPLMYYLAVRQNRLYREALASSAKEVK